MHNDAEKFIDYKSIPTLNCELLGVLLDPYKNKPMKMKCMFWFVIPLRSNDIFFFTKNK